MPTLTTAGCAALLAPLIITQAPLVAPTAGVDRANVGTFTFELRDAESGAPSPGRLTVVGTPADGKPIFMNFQAHPHDLALRDDVVYTLSGSGSITLPAGAYAVYASRGIEWSVARIEFVVRPGHSVHWAADLEHELDTTGWMSGDFHLHTLTHSGHGDSNLPERIISLIGEGVEFAVATDHNHHTDYHPTIADLGADEHLTAVTGNEVSVPIGHFNAFPLSPERQVARGFTDANELFRVLRAEPNAFDVEPVVQVNHPRWDGIDYFNIAGLDPVTAHASRGTWSDDFDTLEVLNENVGWGYYEPGVDGPLTGAQTHSVLRDWFNLLNVGQRHFAVGNSDSHTVAYALAGYPRNYVRTESDDPAHIDVPAYASAIKSGSLFTTTGPFLEFTVNGADMGETVAAADGVASADVHVTAARWIDCDRVRLIINGYEVAHADIPNQPVEERTVERLRNTFSMHLDHDSWIVALVEGDDPMEPIVSGGDRPVRPIAVSNPVWVDADDDGVWTSPAAHATELVAHAADARAARQAVLALPPPERGCAILGAVAMHRPFAGDLVRDALQASNRLVRMFALRAAEALASGEVAPAIAVVLRSDAAAQDPWLRVAALRAYATCAPRKIDEAMTTLLASGAQQMPSWLLAELAPLAPGAPVAEWMVLGYFDAPEAGTVTSRDFGPETDGDIDRSWPGRGGPDVHWQAHTAGADGTLDLRGLADDDDRADNALAFAQCWIHCDAQRAVTVALGTDDGCRVALNGTVVYENAARKGVSPFEHVATWSLESGWNRVLFAVENGNGAYGLTFRVLADDVTVRATRE